MTKKKFLFIIPILVIGFGLYWLWPQPSIPAIIDEGQHISQETHQIIEKSNAENKIKIQYLFCNETNESLSDKAKSLELDQKHDVFYVLMKPSDNNPFRNYSDTSYIQASPSLEKKLVDDHPNMTNIVGPYIYGKNYDMAVLKVNERLRTTTYFLDHEGHINYYDIGIKTLYILFIILIIVKILLSMFIDDDDDNDDGSSHGENEMLATTNIMLASTIINHMH